MVLRNFVNLFAAGAAPHDFVNLFAPGGARHDFINLFVFVVCRGPEASELRRALG